MTQRIALDQGSLKIKLVVMLSQCWLKSFNSPNKATFAGEGTNLLNLGKNYINHCIEANT